MELVYLWVEDYKNIHKQGFNFSPRFNCKYDDETNELTIDENEDYIENFFGENINITAIVGKNGSGKSSILKKLLELFVKKNLLNTKNKKVFLIIQKDNIWEYISYDDANISIIFNKNKINYKINHFKFYTIYYNYLIDSLLDSKEEAWINTVYHKSDRYQSPILIEPSKYNQKINLEEISYHNNQNILRFYKNINNNQVIKEFFIPNKIYLTFLTSKLLLKGNSLSETLRSRHLECNGGILNLDQGHVLRSIDKKNFKEVNLIYLVLKTLTSIATTEFQQFFLKVDKKKFNFWKKKKTLSFEKFYDKYIKDKNIFDRNSSEFEKRKIKLSIKFHEDKIYKNKYLADAFIEKKNLENLSSILEIIPPWAEIEFFQNEKSFNSLSSGEKSLFTFILSILLHIENIYQKNIYNTINLFLDETELGLHPEWQKEYIYKVLTVLKQIKFLNINILLTTHSPFLLSDIPHQNIIFLNDNTNIQQTFGANIHTLLSDSFFMKDGLMGKFAKTKIQEIMDFLNDKKSIDEISTKEEDIKKVIEAIGEPFLKEKLLQMYYKKFQDESIKEKRKQELLAEQKRIEEELKRL